MTKEEAEKKIKELEGRIKTLEELHKCGLRRLVISHGSTPRGRMVAD